MKIIALMSWLILLSTIYRSAAEDQTSPRPEGWSGTAEAPVFVPYFFDGFEDYPAGASLSAGKPFDAAGRTTASSEQARHGGHRRSGANHLFDRAGKISDFVDLRFPVQRKFCGLITVNGLMAGVGRAAGESLRAPAPPRVFLETGIASTPVTGQTIEVGPDGDFQAALDKAKPGDEIVLQAGTAFGLLVPYFTEMTRPTVPGFAADLSEDARASLLRFPVLGPGRDASRSCQHQRCRLETVGDTALAVGTTTGLRLLEW